MTFVSMNQYALNHEETSSEQPLSSPCQVRVRSAWDIWCNPLARRRRQASTRNHQEPPHQADAQQMPCQGPRHRRHGSGPNEPLLQPAKGGAPPGTETQERLQAPYTTSYIDSYSVYSYRHEKTRDDWAGRCACSKTCLDMRSYERVMPQLFAFRQLPTRWVLVTPSDSTGTPLPACMKRGEGMALHVTRLSSAVVPQTVKRSRQSAETRLAAGSW